MKRTESMWAYRAAGAMGGLLLCAGNLVGPLVVLQLGAFVGVLVLSLRRRAGREGLFLAGLYMGLAYSLPQMAALCLPVVMTVVLLVKMTAVLCVLVMVGGAVIRCGRLGPWLFAAVLTVGDWVNFVTPPAWGTAQSLGRAWSSYPTAIGFAQWTGIGGVVFVVALVQGYWAVAVARRSWRACVGPAVLVGVVVAAGAVNGSAGKPLRVAAVGWNDDSLPAGLDFGDAADFDRLCAAAVAHAAGQGARLVVWPELAFSWGGRHRAVWVGRFTELAKRYGTGMVVGYFNEDERDNRALVVSGDGRVAGEYVKMHLTPFEPFAAGCGEPVEVTVDGVRVGVMICHDDNFTDISRRYGCRGVPVMAVPTLDWPAVRAAHLQNSIHRAIESRYAVVRAARNGISAVIGPGGRVAARCDHCRSGRADGANGLVGDVQAGDTRAGDTRAGDTGGLEIVVADVVAAGGPTVFTRVGHWPAGVSGVMLLGAACWGLLRRRLAVESRA